MRTVLIVISCVFYFACNDNKAETITVSAPPVLSPKYYFYPKANVYYDSVNRDYLFLTNDGRTWQTEKQIPAAMQVFMDKSVLIDSPSSPVWKDNGNHKLLYSALLYATRGLKTKSLDFCLIFFLASEQFVKKLAQSFAFFFYGIRVSLLTGITFF